MGEKLMIEPDKIDRMERTLVGVEKAVTELAVIQKESAKREQRIYDRVDKLEQKVEDNTKMLWKFTGGISALIFVSGFIFKFFG